MIFYLTRLEKVGGIAPGSMPPSSTELWEEGAVFSSFRLVHQGRLDEEGLRKILLDDPATNPGCSGSRCYKDNVADLKAQVAANHCGIRLIRQMISEYTMGVVHVSHLHLPSEASSSHLARYIWEPFKTRQSCLFVISSRR